MRLPRSAFSQQHRLLRPATVFASGLLAILVSGCATQSDYGESRYGADRIAMEDDGLPAQLPPLRRRTMDNMDDPREPFSPNYGPPPQPSLPADLPPKFRRKLINAVSIS